MKQCNGCKYHVPSFDVCSHNDPEFVWETNPYTGKYGYRITGYFRPKVEKMRAEGGDCGPDAKLYSPTLLRKIILKITG